eukprot:m.176077 g.176077  ORF g.176077 m.176077 type:complete len:317 (+) comp14105_c0_seq1:107-1057(+)
MPGNTTLAPTPGPNSTTLTTAAPTPVGHGLGNQAPNTAGVVVGVLVALVAVVFIVVVARRRGFTGLFQGRRKRPVYKSSLGTALLSAGDRGGPMRHNDDDGQTVDDDAIIEFDSTFDDHTKYTKYALEDDEDEDTTNLVVYDKYVGDTVTFEGGPEAQGTRSAMASLSSDDQRPTSTELARAKCIILEGSRLQMQRELEEARREKEALMNQVEAEHQSTRKISGVNGALARQNLKLKTEYQKLQKEYKSREDELQNAEINLDEHLLMKVPTPSSGANRMPAAFTEFRGRANGSMPLSEDVHGNGGADDAHDDLFNV